MKTKVTKRQIQSVLMKSVFTPSEKNPLSIVINMDDPNYAELKSTELIAEARLAFKQGSLRVYQDKMEQAISLLALARVQRETVSSQKQG